MAASLFLGGCSDPPPRAEKPKPDPASTPEYGKSVEQLDALNRQAEDLLKRGRAADAAEAITKGQPLQVRLLAAPQPTLAAMQAASDLDDLYARMLLSNGHEGWARMLFQKNLSRWKLWKTPTADTARRLRQAQAGIEECDRRLRQ